MLHRPAWPGAQHIDERDKVVCKSKWACNRHAGLAVVALARTDPHTHFHQSKQACNKLRPSRARSVAQLAYTPAHTLLPRPPPADDVSKGRAGRAARCPAAPDC